MIHPFNGNTADDVWLKAVAAFAQGNHVTSQSSRGGNTAEMLHAALAIQSPLDRWVVSRVPALNPAFSIVESVWVMNGRHDAAFLNAWNRRLPEYAGRCQNYHGAYGQRLRYLAGFDQLTRAYEALRGSQHSRQVVLQIWDPKQDFPREDGTPVAEDIPCNIVSMLKLRDNKLEWMQIVRSNDLFLGVPHDLALFTLLQEVMAGWLNAEVGTYNQISDSLHVYEQDIVQIQRVAHVPFRKNIDSLSLPKEQSEIVWSEFARRVESLAARDLTQRELLSQLNWGAPGGYLNLLRVICAEAARKRKWYTIVSDVVSDVSNPILSQLWRHWYERIEGKDVRGTTSSGASLTRT